MHDLLLRFLGKGLIDVGGDDDKLDRLRQTAADLSAILGKTPAKASSFTLVAFDPGVSTTDPTIIEVGDALRNRWETYINTFAETPVTVFRAMLLDGLVQTCRRNEAVAVAFAASARNVLPFTETSGEEEIWADVVREIEDQVEARAEREWVTPDSISVPDPKFEPPSGVEIKILSKKVDKNTLGQRLRAAAGPTYYHPERGGVNTNGNPEWARDTGGQWVSEFGTRAGAAVAETINRTIGSLSVEAPDLLGVAGDMIGVMSEHLTTTLQAVSDATAGLQRRTRLLWWKESLFSPSARNSYREMSTFDAAVLMAFDIHRQIPTFSPTSVAAFLRETVIGLPTVDQEQKFRLRDLVDNTRDAATLAELKTEARNLVSARAGRGPILALVAHPEATRQVDDRAFRDFVGVSPDTMLSLPDWSVWIFRELQAARAIAEAAAPKRRTRRKRTGR